MSLKSGVCFKVKGSQKSGQRRFQVGSKSKFLIELDSLGSTRFILIMMGNILKGLHLL